MSARPSSTAEILFRFLDFSMLCRQEKFPSRYFRSVASVAGDASGCGMRRRASAGRRAAEILSAFLNLSMLCKQENFLPLLSERRVRRWRCGRFRNEALLSVGTRGRPRARIPDVVAWRLPRPYQFRARIQSFQVVAAPFPGNLATTSIVGDAAGFGTRPAASIGWGVAPCAKPQWRGHRRDHHGDGRSRRATVVWPARGPRGTGSLETQGHGQARSQERRSVTIT
jgi:hypothetical protein